MISIVMASMAYFPKMHVSHFSLIVNLSLSSCVFYQFSLRRFLFSKNERENKLARLSQRCSREKKRTVPKMMMRTERVQGHKELLPPPSFSTLTNGHALRVGVRVCVCACVCVCVLKKIIKWYTGPKNSEKRE